jgi:hypothetical protein
MSGKCSHGSDLIQNRRDEYKSNTEPAVSSLKRQNCFHGSICKEKAKESTVPGPHSVHADAPGVSMYEPSGHAEQVASAQHGHNQLT